MARPQPPRTYTRDEMARRMREAYRRLRCEYGPARARRMVHIMRRDYVAGVDFNLDRRTDR